MSELSRVSVTALKGVGEAMAEKLAKVGLENLQDVLFHLPLRYQDRTRIVPIGALSPGQDAVIEGVVSGADVVMGKRAACWCGLATAPVSSVCASTISAMPRKKA